MNKNDKLFAEAAELGLKNIPYSDNIEILNTPITIDGIDFQNRMVIQPMEGCDGTAEGKPDELTRRRYHRFARSGAGLIWLEAVAIVEEGRANPRQLLMSVDNIDSYKAMIDSIKNVSLREYGFEPKIIMQATHSGRYSKPEGKPAPIIAYNNPLFEKDNPISKDRIITDDALKRLEETYGVAANMAQQAGFDGIDIKCCHRYLASELLSAYNRPGKFGGSFENRTRLLINGIKNAQAATDSDFIVTTRLNVYDGFEYPYGFGVKEGSGLEIDLTEPKKLVDILHNKLGIKLIDITIGNPYVNSYVNRPSRTKQNLAVENPLIGVDRMYYCVGEIQKAFPELAVVGSGVSFFGSESPNLAAGAIEQGYMKLQGFGRMAFAYPDFAKDIAQKGELDKSKVCISCGKCTEIMRAGSVTGCVIKDSDVYMPLYKKYVLEKEI